jgi:hypothetical protein
MGKVFKRNNFLISFAIAIVVVFFGLQLAKADDSEDDLRIIDTNPKNNQVQTVAPTTVTTNVKSNVTQEITTTVKVDSDGDGILDEEDLHPTINNNFIVKDDNLNGIDDRYEQAIMP